MLLLQAGPEGKNQVRVSGLTQQENELMLLMSGLRPQGCGVIKERKQTPSVFMAMASAWAGEAAQTRVLGHLRQDNSIIQLPCGTGSRGVG